MVNIANLLLATARHQPSAAALVRGKSVTADYAALANQSVAIAGALQAMGLRPGDRVALAMTNALEYLSILFGCWFAGLCIVPINAKLHRNEFKYILDNAGAKICFCSPSLAESVAPLADELQTLARVIVTEAHEVARLTRNDAGTFVERGRDDPAWLFYTSGTTGRPKGATLSHANLFAMSAAYYADIDFLDTRDSILHAAPLSHGSGAYALPHIARGSAQVFPESSHFEPAEILDLLRTHRHVSFFAAPTMVNRLVAQGCDDVPGLKTIIYGGAPMYVADLEKALACFGPRLYQLYGQGESPMTITGLPKQMHGDGEDQQERLASVGIARFGMEVRIADDQGRTLPVGEIGEIVARGDCVMLGYWDNPAATASSIRDGWLYTGDVGALNARGFLTLKDRSKDMLISGGSNIYPREIEEALLTHPDVTEAAVVGQPDQEWGEIPVAFVVRRGAANPDAAELDRHCLTVMARFKRPRAYRFVDALPKNNYGKVLKTELRLMIQ